MFIETHLNAVANIKLADALEHSVAVSCKTLAPSGLLLTRQHYSK